MSKRVIGIVIAAAIAAAASGAALAKDAAGLEAFAGKWRIDLAKTRLERFNATGANVKRSDTFTWVFSPTAYGLQFDVYAEYPQPAPTRTMTVIADARPHPCQGPKPCLTTGGVPKEQSYAYWRMDNHMLARLFYEKGKVVEYSSYAVSADTQTLVIDSWSPETPWFHNFQVFNKIP